MKSSGLKQILLMVKARTKGEAKKTYSCWLCNRRCEGTADYLLHLQAHRDAIERQNI